VLTIHDLAWRHEPDHFTPRGVRFFRQHLEVAMRDVALVFCSSEATRRDCLEVGFAADRLRVVPLGARSIETTDEAIQLARAKHGLRRPYVMWAGTREPRKNLAGLLAAFVELDRNDLDLVLVGPPGWGDEIDTVIAGMTGRIHVLGFVDRAEQAALYAGASVFCFPSLREGFGLPVLEAMNQGTPVVTSLGTATEEVAGQAAKLVEPRDPSAIAAAVAEILDDPRLARDLGRMGRARAGEFTWRRSADLVVDGYREVLA
jgi:glycosyltransferase involved in cell wall biosynthesis